MRGYGKKDGTANCRPDNVVILLSCRRESIVERNIENIGSKSGAQGAQFVPAIALTVGWIY